MNPIDFPEANFTFDPPAGMGDCGTLRVLRSERAMKSLWMPTVAEREILASGGVVTLEVFGAGHPPVAVSAATIDADGSIFAALKAADALLALVREACAPWTEAEREQARRELAKPDRCNWPGCDEPGLCQSGNFGNLVVCAEHFHYTNGAARPEFRDLGGTLKDGEEFARRLPIGVASPASTSPHNVRADRLCEIHGLGFAPGQWTPCPQCIAEADAKFALALQESATVTGPTPTLVAVRPEDGPEVA